VVAERERGHFQLGGALGEFGNPARAIEEAVLGMDVKMDEVFQRGHGLNLVPF
jgi:hypothetical protein